MMARLSSLEHLWTSTMSRSTTLLLPFIGESNILPGTMIEDYLVEFNGKRFEAVDGGMKPNEPVEVVIRPEDLRITLPEEGKLQVKVDTQLFRGVHYEIIAYDELGNEWMIPLNP